MISVPIEFVGCSERAIWLKGDRCEHGILIVPAQIGGRVPCTQMGIGTGLVPEGSDAEISDIASMLLVHKRSVGTERAPLGQVETRARAHFVVVAYRNI